MDNASMKTKEAGHRGWRRIAHSIGAQKLVAFLALLVIYGFFSVVSPPFRTWDTLVSIFDASYYVGFLAIGVTFVIVTGGIDLSIGTLMICSTLIGGTLYNRAGWPLALCLLVVLFCGALFGLCNGVMVALLKLPPFIATLGTMMVTRGLGSIITRTRSVTYPLPTSPDSWYKSLFRTAENFPVGIFLLLGLALVMIVVLGKTRLGRYALAIGSNREAARLSGVNVAKWEISTYVISGVFAAIAGIAYAATYTTLLPNTGNGFELDAIAGVVIGGTSLAGGVGSVVGTIIGVFIMSALKVGLPFVDMQPHYQLFITGLVLIVAVYVDVRNSRRRG